MEELLNNLSLVNDHDSKIQLLNQLKTLLETSLIPNDEEERTPLPFDAITTLIQSHIKSNNFQLLTVTLSVLPTYFNLLVHHLLAPTTSSSPTTPMPSVAMMNHASHVLRTTFIALLPTEHLKDSKDRIRELAMISMIAAGRCALRLGVSVVNSPWDYLSRNMVELGFRSKNAKAREQALYYVLALREPTEEHPQPPLRPFTPFLLALLSDADPSVRSLALSTTITIFSSPTVPAAAKTDLKKEMYKLQVAKKVQDQILHAVLGPGEVGAVYGETTTTQSLKSPNSKPLPARAITSPRSQSSLPPLPSTAFPAENSQPLSNGSQSEVATIYIASEIDLRQEFSNMLEGFDGKETEFNWIIRDKNVGRIRGMLKGGIRRTPYSDDFLIGFKSVMDGVLKTASSLRTTVATTALSLIHELSNEFGPLLDAHFLEPLLSHCLSMAGQTKKIVATASQAAVTALLTNSCYHLKTLQLLWTGMNDKIVLARTFVSAHVGTFVRVYGVSEKSGIESSGGIEILEMCLKKGLGDPNATVKDHCRTTYWECKEIFPTMTEKVWNSLDATARKQLEKVDPSKKGGVTAAASMAVNRSKNGPVKGRVSMKEMMAEKARLLAASTAEESNSALLPTATPSTSSIRSPPSLSSPSPIRSHPPKATTIQPSDIEPIQAEEVLQREAHQAEVAAEQLLELVIDDQPSISTPTPAKGSSKSVYRRLIPAHPHPTTPLGKKTVDIFADSPAVKNRGLDYGRKNWWKSEKSIDPLAVLDTPERLIEIDQLIIALKSGIITLDQLKMLSIVCSERPLEDEEGESNPNWKFWKSSPSYRFATLFEGIVAIFQHSPTEEKQLEPALRLLEALVISQGPAFFGSESLVLYTLLNVPTSASNRSSIAATEVISESFCDQLEPLYGLAAVRSAMGRRLVADESEGERKGEDSRSGIALGMTMRMMGNFFKRLPKEVLEDEIPKVAHILRLGLKNSLIGTRQTTISAVVIAHGIILDEAKLLNLLQGDTAEELATDQMNLLAYYFSR